MAGAATPGRVNLQQYEILRDNTIAVTQPDRILKHSQARRRLDYQQLVRCYIYQLEHGCGTSSCTAPTCWTYRQRVATKPLRKYTSVSARVVAHTLSSADGPQSSLCQFAVAASGIHDRERPLGNVVQPEQTKVDSKSLVQNLFNTIPLRTVKPTSFGLSAGLEEEGSKVESLAHLTGEIMNALRQFHVANHPKQPDPRLCQGADLLKSKVSGYVDQSLFYTLSDAPTIVKSFRETSSGNDEPAPLSHIDSLKVEEAFKAWPSINGSLVFDSLWQGLEALFTPPPEIASTTHFHATQATQPPYINDIDAAHIATICIHAITASVRTASASAWHEVCCYHRRLGSESQDEEAERRPHTHTTSSLAIIDELEYEPARRLVDRLVRAISARVCFYEISKTRGSFTDSPGQPDPPSFMEFILQHLRHAYTHWVETGREETTLSELGWPTCFKFLQQLRTTFLDDWDGEAELNRWGAAGSAVQIMAYLYEHHEDLGLPVESLQFRGLGDELDRLHNRDSILKRWFERSPDRNTLNLLSYPFLFAPKYLILCSRIINSMFMNYAIRTSMILRRQHEDYVRQQRVRNVRDHLAARLYHSMHEHLVVNIRREHILEDAFYALWHREKRELFLPLRVRMGMNEGEIGHALGGVQTEFFRLAFIEALKPETGMFVTDRESRMTWFQPPCLEPLNRFEQLGLLVSLALYNNVMLPFTFPHALYRKLQGLPVDNLRHIRDGWPALAKGLDSMLSWDDGDVRAVFWRSYVFSFEAYDQIIDVDMEKFGREDQWPAVYATEEAEGQTGIRDALVNVPSPHTNPSTDLASIAWRRPRPLNPTTRDTDGSDDTTDEALGSEEPQAVTNANRAQYVADYIFWLTDKSIRPQYMAFERGFRTFLKPKQVSIHTPGSLQTAIEGLRREINIDDLRASTTYEGYSAEHRVVRWFWRVVGAYSHEQKCKLLEFVTATSRVPVNGAAGIIFEIRWGGPDGERLPSSQTCFGALYLLEYDSLDKLSLKLGIALEHGLGFGVV